MALAGIAAAWFRREDWPRWRAIDPDLQPDYDQWLSRMEQRLKQIADTGQTIEKVMLNPDVFLAWSAEFAGGAVDTKARSSYAAHRLAGKIDRSKHH